MLFCWVIGYGWRMEEFERVGGRDCIHFRLVAGSNTEVPLLLFLHSVFECRLQFPLG